MLLHGNGLRGLFLKFAEFVAEEVEQEKSEGEEQGRKDDQPPRSSDGVEEGGTIGKKGAPTGEGGLDAESQKAEERFFKNNRG
jgi:hypothetical protein